MPGFVNYFYPLLFKFRRFLYESGIFKKHSFPFPVISVGSLSAGGAGKTPFSIYLSSLLKENADVEVWHVVNPYRVKVREIKVLKNFEVSKSFSDEAILSLYYLSPQGVNVLIGRSKINCLKSIKFNGKAIAVVDDAYQTPSFKRVLDIVIIDRKDFYDSELLLPSTILRVQPSSLRGDEVIVLRDFVNVPEIIKERIPENRIFKLNRKHKFFSWNFEPVGEDELKEKSFFIICAIAKPQRFEEEMKNYITLVKTFFFRDHSDISLRRLKKLIRDSPANIFFLTTMKDRMRFELMKVPEEFARRCIICDLDVMVDDERRFLEVLRECLPSEIKFLFSF